MIDLNRIKDILLIAIALCIGYIIVKHMIREWKNINDRKDGSPVIITNSYFNIKQAVLCVDCETVFSSQAYKQCPRCSSKSLFTISYTFQTESIWKHTNQEGATIQ